ncbi:hypothetical protein ERJ75_000647200 [Trypanosoma vivax]|nr:hypothetical protein ERJ75_000647200 [Trypanosoma vivax]
MTRLGGEDQPDAGGRLHRKEQEGARAEGGWNVAEAGQGNRALRRTCRGGDRNERCVTRMGPTKAEGSVRNRRDPTDGLAVGRTYGAGEQRGGRDVGRGSREAKGLDGEREGDLAATPEGPTGKRPGVGVETDTERGPCQENKVTRGQKTRKPVMLDGVKRTGGTKKDFLAVSNWNDAKRV